MRQPPFRHWIASALVHAGLALTLTLALAVRHAPPESRGAGRLPIGVSLSAGGARANLPEKRSRLGAGIPAKAESRPEASAGDGPVGDSDSRVAATAREAYLSELRARIEELKVYPGVSRRLRETGEVRVRFVVLRDGRIEAVELVGPSAHARLDAAALAAVARLERHRELPPEVPGDRITVEVPIRYVLR